MKAWGYYSDLAEKTILSKRPTATFQDKTAAFPQPSAEFNKAWLRLNTAYGH